MSSIIYGTVLLLWALGFMVHFDPVLMKVMEEEETREEVIFPVKMRSERLQRRTVHRSRSYHFRAFNQTFLLDLWPNLGFVAPHFRISYLESYGNSTLLRPINSSHSDNCFFTGQLRNDPASKVSISLCQGMFGLIHTEKFGDYLVRPVTEMTSEIDLRPHFLKQLFVPHRNTHNNATCGVTDSQLRKVPTLHAPSPRRRNQRSVSRERHLELMVVADVRMARYHGDNLRHYILTLMSTVASIYRDPSIGNDINIVLVQLVVLDEQEDRDIIFPSASKTLRNFCKWQEHQNHYDDNHPFHHDAAILLTREDLCRLTKTCDTLGLAQSGMVCDHYSSCAIVEDNGLSAAFTIAHELGHILNIPHDDEIKCERYQDKGQRLHVMARMLDYNSHPWSWSACSRHYVTSFLDAGYGQCLLDQPIQNLLQPAHFERHPGEVYDMDHQCALVFGRGSKICPYMPVCKRLWCTVEEMAQGGCRTQHMPWADGTSCGHGKWCQHGECVRLNNARFYPVNGEWGKWASYGQCSRSCGGGVKRSVRECDSPRPANGGRYCVGERIRYQSCNTQDCPTNSRDFRLEQCSTFNGKNFNFPGLPMNVKWVPEYVGVHPHDTCKLYCRAVGTGAYYLLKEKVIDGTSCQPESHSLCVNGICMSAGCDRQLESGKKPDLCGVCGGDNSSCRVVTGTFNKIEYGYNHVVTIPAGASNIDIRQYGFNGNKDDNYLVLKSHDSDFILNGNFIVSMFPKTLVHEEVAIQYTGSDSVVERINITKPLKHELSIQVLTVGQLHPPDVKFRYTVSLSDPDLYIWELSQNWSPCTRVCQGERYRQVVCIRRTDQRQVSESNCEDAKPPQLAQVCNTACDLRWHVTQVSECSSPCGKGTRQRTVQCAQVIDDTIHTLADNLCDHLGSKPIDVEECEGSCPVTFWDYGDWSECSKSCGGGDQQRTARCLNDKGQEEAESLCDPQKKLIQRPCNTGTCPRWVVGDWSPCSVPCGIGERQRPYGCQDGDKKVSGNFCDGQPVPKTKELCHVTSCYQWYSEPAGQCSVTCGDGYQRHNVQCRSGSGDPAESHFCQESDRPSETSQCSLPLCPANQIPATKDLNNAILPFPHPFVKEFPPRSSARSAVWVTGDWSECSSTCGESFRTREVKCRNHHNKEQLPDVLCHLATRPPLRDQCRKPACGLWRTGDWSQCSVTCGEGVSTRYVACLFANDVMGSEADCSQSERPESEKPCHGPPCMSETIPSGLPITFNSVEDVHAWIIGPWSECSRSCGGGHHRRQVACYDELGQKSSQCDASVRPEETGTCNDFGCSKWTLGNWQQCSKSCGTGYQSRSVTCTDDNGQLTPEYECTTVYPKPVDRKACNTHDCPHYHWQQGPWKKCSSTCGKGIQRRQISCLDNRGKSVAWKHCSLPVPDQVRNCNQPNCTRWSFSSWSECSGGCLNSTQSRYAVCTMGNIPVKESRCPLGRKPKTERRFCVRKPCSFRWTKSKWTKCSATCDRGERWRRVTCVNSSNIQVPERFCSSHRQPRTFRRCKAPPCPYTWLVGTWSDCSQVCDHGKQFRSVTCHRANAFKWVDPEPLPEPTSSQTSWCNITQRPQAFKSCNLGNCGRRASWRPGLWTNCSVSCGRGFQRRRVKCYDLQGNKLDKRDCDPELKPRNQRRCWNRPCYPISCQDIQKRQRSQQDNEYNITIRGLTVKIYCAMMNTSKPREYLSLKSEAENYSEFYSKRLTHPDTCPNGGDRYDECDCVESEPGNGVGLTTFSKIAFNITSLEIITNIYLFSQTQHGSPVPYGQSSDCYSAVNCPQGRFSINLRGTGFIISPKVVWVRSGRISYMNVHRLEKDQIVQGKCGGYCGKCAPDERTGLLLDVAPP